MLSLTKRLLTLFAALSIHSAAWATMPPSVQNFIDEMVASHAFDRDKLTQLLTKAEHQQEIIDKMTGRAEKSKPWHQYRKIFLNEKRIAGGVAFWNENQALLEKAEKVYGVDPAIIVAILGVETYYGARTGKTKVLDALYTLAFGHKERAAFFRKELEQFLLLAGEAGFDPLIVTGSYAGAMGASQFISSSYRHYGVDFDEDGKIDLWSSKADFIGSVANYFAKHKWQAGKAVAVLVENVDPEKHKTLFLAETIPVKKVITKEDSATIPAIKLVQSGIRLTKKIDDQESTALLPFETADNEFQYWAGLDNFFVITRYNRSPLYAMSVLQLSQEIAKRRVAAKGEAVVAK
jgi:membrane-bound lytic murein transglycosylase B